MDNIVLIGFMGVGKTEVGRLLAKELGYSYIDTDLMIEKEQSRSINDIFGSDGEQVFRDMESSMLTKLKGKKKNVISTGGGIILRPENIKKLKSLGAVVLLRAEPTAIYERIKNEKNRPLLNVPDPKAKIKEILDFRAPIYKNISDFEVDTSALSPDEACNRILEYLRKAQ